MDEHTEQRGVGGLAISRRGSSLSCRDRSHEDRSIRCCNRSGCSTRLSSMKGTNTIKQEQAKSSKPPSLLSSSKTMVGSSSKSSTGMSNLRKHHQEQQNSDSLKATVITVSKRRQQEVEADQSRLSTTGIQTGQTAPENAKTVAFHSLSMNSTKEVCNARPQKPIQQSGFGTRGRGTSMGSSIWHSFSSKNVSQSPKDQGTSAHRYGFKNLVCASISGIHASSSMSDSGRSRKSNAIRQRCPPDGESSSARGKKPGELSETSSQRNDFSGPSLPSTLHLTSQPSSRRMRNQSVSSSVPSVRTRRMISLDTDTRQSNSNNVNVTPESEMIPQLDQAELSINEFASGSSYQSFSTERPSAFLNSLRWPGSSEETARPRRSRPATRPENSSARPFHSFSLGHDGFRRLSMEIAEALLALERVEQAEELTYERLLALESNMFSGRLSFYDQHGDMRLDIDSMSYEELLALEEKMGTVSISLTEEQLSNCVKISCYVPAPMVPGTFVGSEDDGAKCSICQEEYAVGDEVGKLRCEHQYHVRCIYKWLKQKNWCPICKASVARS